MTPKNQTLMTRAEFQDLLDTYGARRDDWPEAGQVRALELMAADAKARVIFEKSLAVENALTSDPVPAHRPEVFVDLFQKIANLAEYEAQQSIVVSGASAGFTFRSTLRKAISELRVMLVRPELIVGTSTTAGILLGLFNQAIPTEQPVDLVLAYMVAVFSL